MLSVRRAGTLHRMAQKLTVQLPGLLQKAKAAKRALDRLYDQLADTQGSHATVSSDLSTARTNVNTLITAIADL